MKKKFTLLELLIVVAMIGILVSILLPSLKNAHLKTIRALCLSNLKQLHIAQTSYSNNSNRLLAVSSRGVSWSTYSDVALHVWSKDVFDPFRENYLNESVEVFLCPVQNPAQDWWKWSSIPDKRLTSYMSATNEHLSPTTVAGMSAPIWRKENKDYYVTRYSKVEDTGQMLFADLIRYYPAATWWNIADNKFKYGNPEGGNEIQIDGAAKWRSFSKKQVNYMHDSWPYYWYDPR